jgi:hypothetical protein
VRLRDAQFHLEILDSHMQKAGLDDQTPDKPTY